MTKLSELRKKEVISSDGHIIGNVQSAIITQEKTIIGITIKIKNSYYCKSSNSQT